MRQRRRNEPKVTAALGVGAIALVLVVGWISYNALTGLPLQSRYRVEIELPDAQRLGATDDVRVAGVRVGQVTSVRAERDDRSGRPYAVVALDLQPSVGRLPIDTTAIVEEASALGATYVQLDLGSDDQTVAPGGTLPLAQARNSVSVTDLFQIFDERAARNFQDAIGGLGAGLAGRGRDLNATIGSVSKLLPPATNVSAALAAPDTRLSEFISGWASASTAFSTRSQELAALVSGGASTFTALADERRALGATIEALPPAEIESTRAFVAVRPGLDGLAGLLSDLQPAGRMLPGALRTVNSTVSAGIRPMSQLPTLSRPLKGALVALRDTSRIPSTDGALRKLDDMMAALQDVLSALTPAQVHCNVLGLFGQNLSSATGTLGTGAGPAFSLFGLATVGNLTDALQSARPAPNAHINNDPTANASECESNNEPYNGQRQVLTPPAGQQPSQTRPTSPPPGVLDRAGSVGLLAPEVPKR
jgi:virulence factor Mce-like protein